MPTIFKLQREKSKRTRYIIFKCSFGLNCYTKIRQKNL